MNYDFMKEISSIMETEEKLADLYFNWIKEAFLKAGKEELTEGELLEAILDSWEDVEQQEKIRWIGYVKDIGIKFCLLYSDLTKGRREGEVYYRIDSSWRK